MRKNQINRNTLMIIGFFIATLSFQNCSQPFHTNGSAASSSSSSFESSPPTSMPPSTSLPVAAPNSNMTAACSQGLTYYISPSGNNSNPGSQNAPFKTFAYAFSKMRGGDQLYLLNGTYSTSAGTGIIHWTDQANEANSGFSAQIPSGTNFNKMTCVRSLNPGTVQILGGLFVGRSFRKDRFIYIEGITFKSGGGIIYHGDSIYVKNCGFESSLQEAGSILGTGSNDRDATTGGTDYIVNSNILFEDVWLWGKERIGLLIYRSNNVVVRRAIVRVDGCDSHSKGCGNNSGNAMVGITTYNSHHVAMENVLVLDNIYGPGGYEGGSDIQTAWHDNYVYPFGANQWLGVMSINSEYGGMYPEVDGPIAGMMYQPLYTYKNIVIANPKGSGVSAQAKTSMGGTGINVENITVVDNSSGDAFRVGPEYENASSSYVRNLLIKGRGVFGVNSSIAPTHVNLFGTWTESAYEQTSCSGTCLTTNPVNDGVTPSLKYLTRVENGSKLKGAGFGGNDIGANVINRYGVDGTFFGTNGYDNLTSQSLWPYPNQARIQKEMCTDSRVTRGFCAKANISYYIWDYLGNSCPSGLCE